MSFANKYFSRYKTYPKIFENNPCPQTGIIVIIPCYDDEFIFETLKSLEKAQKPICKIEIIVIVNSGEKTPKHIVQKNKEIFLKLNEQAKNEFYKTFNLLVYNIEDTAHKIAGVGFARKLGIDEAVRRFNFLNKPQAIICSLDADSIVSDDYFIEIYNYFENNPKIKATTFQFKHNFDENIFSLDEIKSCKLYEIYLRYFRLAIKSTGFPYSIHTIGACFGFRADAYCKVGGMPTRQAGEDFYFLHKLTAVSKIGNINKPIIFPAPRFSDRVPFGTGPTVIQINKTKEYEVYNFKIFEIIKQFFNALPQFYETSNFIELIPSEIIEFYTKEKLIKDINDCKNNSSNIKNFTKRFFSKFDAFFIIQFLNSFDKASKYPAQQVLKIAQQLLNSKNIEISNSNIDEIYEQMLKLDLIEN